MPASSCFACDRDHIRLFQLPYGDHRLVLGDAHHDKSVFFAKGCTKWIIPVSHIASTFDYARDEIKRVWRGAHLAYWGNTRRMAQCDGSTTHSDGYVLEEAVAKLPPPSQGPAGGCKLAVGSGIPTTLGARETLAQELDATLQELHQTAKRAAAEPVGAACGDERNVCELLAPEALASGNKLATRAAASKVAKYTEECAGRLATEELATLAKGGAGQRVTSATRSGDLAIATLAGPELERGAGAKFILLAGRWRVLARAY